MVTILIILALVLLILIILNHTYVKQPYTGCAGTEYGCCPDGITSRMDYLGTNCSGYSPYPPPQPPSPPPPPMPPLPPPPMPPLPPSQIP